MLLGDIDIFLCQECGTVVLLVCDISDRYLLESGDVELGHKE